MSDTEISQDRLSTILSRTSNYTLSGKALDEFETDELRAAFLFAYDGWYNNTSYIPRMDIVTKHLSEYLTEDEVVTIFETLEALPSAATPLDRLFWVMQNLLDENLDRVSRLWEILANNERWFKNIATRPWSFRERRKSYKQWAFNVSEIIVNSSWDYSYQNLYHMMEALNAFTPDAVDKVVRLSLAESVKDKSGLDTTMLLKRSLTPVLLEEAYRAAQEDDKWALRKVGLHVNTPGWVLEELAIHPMSEVRIGVARNISASDELLAVFASDKSKVAAKSAKATLLKKEKKSKNI